MRASTTLTAVAAVLAAEVRAHRWVPVATVALLLAAVARSAPDLLLEFPLLDRPVPAPVVISLAATVLVLVPLGAAYPLLERTLLRENGIRALRAGTALALAGPAAAASGGGWVAVSRFCMLGALGLLATTAIGELSWTLPLSLGVLTIVADGSGSRPVTRLIGEVPATVAGVVLLVAVAGYAAQGPRMLRS